MITAMSDPASSDRRNANAAERTRGTLTLLRAAALIVCALTLAACDGSTSSGIVAPRDTAAAPAPASSAIGKP